jgi:histidinol-phosphate phosphatase family protein
LTESEIVLIMGFPAAGKTTLVEQFKDYTRLNRDTLGGTTSGLAQRLQERIDAGKKRFVLDNTFPTVQSRAYFIKVGKRNDIPVRCVWLKTSFEDATVNACLRMHRKYGKVLDLPEIDEHGKKDPNCFPIGAIFRYRKLFEKPTLSEGFSALKVVRFDRQWDESYKNKALILDYDGTLRETISGEHYPRSPDDVRLLPRRKEVIQRYLDQGFILVGVSNQSGVGKGALTWDQAFEGLQRTNDLLGMDIDFKFCPHNSFPVTCYCRKPQVGLGIELVETYKLNPAECIMVGDQKTEATFAKSCGFEYRHPDQFFKG